ncbi:polysaccharide deacetylase family protein [Paenibacillus glycanilyticus]|uniref:polysaccharide deacetylase family protein n=1 Tax=Paenibacillus glycanilyticus TaxID=126569 RepID=UPI00203AB6A1|nr:polysaccharide deacetylase family protein [Paenibacillus glycanilyticus]MCM3630895.1 polysaccharide deacetylase family protein [Paenibacillus glycanilyticus]
MFRGLAVVLIAGMLALASAGCGSHSGAAQNEGKEAQPQPNAYSDEGVPIRIQEDGDDDTPELVDGSEKAVRKEEPLTLAELREKYRSTFLLEGDSKEKRVALTFDDGPDETFTPLVLDVLKKAGVKATFFVVGNRIEANPEIFQRILNEGHAVGNHSYSHPNFLKLSDEDFRDEINATDKLIKTYIGYLPSLVRPPYGGVTEDQINWLASMEKKIINWNVDSLDWKGLKAEEVYANIMNATKNGSIILQHSAGGEGEDLTGSVEALGRVIAKLKAKNMELVTVPDLIHLK